MNTVAEELNRLGGVARRRVLIERCSRAAVDTALAHDEIVNASRGCLSLPVADSARVAAISISGALCLASAALHHGWAVKFPPDRPQVVLARNRIYAAHDGVDARWFRLAPGEVMDSVTTRERTLLDCMRFLPPDEALAIADSALRDGHSASWLRALAENARGPGSAQARWVAARASGDAANPFESVLRWISYGVPGLHLRPQVTIRHPGPTLFGDGTVLGRVDLADVDLRLIAEADSFEWHGGRRALREDARRYNNFIVAGWRVLRFSWDDVMFAADHVRMVLDEAVKLETNAEQRLAS